MDTEHHCLAERDEVVGRVLVCTGKYAQEPYFFSSVCVNVYCVEELCFLFANNPFMINTDVMDKGLIRWLEVQCDLEDLAKQLSASMKKGIQAGEFVDIIINYVNYCTEEEKATMDVILKDNAGLNEFERRKKQADYLMQNERYQMALNEYENLCQVLPDTESALRPLIYHNMGYAYASLFMFDVAAKYYKKAYEMTGDHDSGMQYLASLRVYLSEEEYISYIADHPEHHTLSMMLEKKINAAKGKFEASRENRMLSALKIYKEEGNAASYYEEMDKIIYRLKEEYLQMVME